MKKFNGKPMSHWERMATKLVIDGLVRASQLDTRSLPGKMASERLLAMAEAESPELLKEVLAERQAFSAGVAGTINAILVPAKAKR